VKVSEPGGARQEKVTIRHVAQEAGVSIATVSRVVNGHSDVSAETRQAVERVLRERGYPAGGRRARIAATGLIGVTMPFVNPGYFAQILSGAAEALYEQDLRAVLCPTRHSHERETSLLDQLASGGAAAYVRNADGGGAIGLLHAVTSPLASEMLLPWLEEADQDAALGYVWQAVAALHVAYDVDRSTPLPDGDVPTAEGFAEELVDRAVASGDEHALKLCEAALRSFGRSGDSVLLAAAADACERL